LLDFWDVDVYPFSDRLARVFGDLDHLDYMAHRGRSTARVRALLDQDSAFIFIIESLTQVLCAQWQRANIHITGFGAQSNHAYDRTV